MTTPGNISEEVRPLYVRKSSKLTQELILQLDLVFDFASPEEYRDTLLEIYQVYIIHEHKTLPGKFEDMALQVFALLDFLRDAQKQMLKVE
jgi:hypothetical protein